jgi:glutathione S-transferase
VTIRPQAGGYEARVLELWQAEWCPHSHRVRERLTELGVDFVARQVAPKPRDRDAMRAAVGSDSIPVLVAEDGRTFEDDDAILVFLDATYAPAENEPGHRAQELAHPPLEQGASRAGAS